MGASQSKQDVNTNVIQPQNSQKDIDKEKNEKQF